MSQLYDIVQAALANTSAFHALTGTGVGLSAFLVLANVGGAHFGVVPMVASQTVRQQLNLPIELAVRQWRFFFTRATPPVVIGVAGGSLAYLAASFFVPEKHPNRAGLTNWMRFAAALAFVPLPYTVQALGPTNKALLALAAKAGQMGAQDASHAQTLLETWVFRHGIRMGLYTVSMIAGIIPLLAL